MLRKTSSLLVVLPLLVGFALAQVTTATISGVVRDTTGAVLPGATVMIQNEDMGVSRTVATDSGGRYHASSLSLGNYQVTATLEGFQTEVRRGIVLTVGREAVVNFQLQVGTVTQSIEVTGEAPLVDTTSAAIEGLVDNTRIMDLPLNGRSFEQLATLEPGVTFSRASTKGFDTGQTERISVAGANPNLNRFLLDGTDVMDLSSKGPGSAAGAFLGVETLREFKVLTSNYSAQYGATAAGIISAVTKSGTNELHGAVFEFLRNSAVDARNFFDGAKVPPFRRNQFGFTLGGPLVRNKTFFFGSYEGLRNALTETRIWNVFSNDARRGFLPNAQTKQLEFVGIDPQVKVWLDAYPEPNGRDFGDGVAEYSAPVRRPSNDDYYMIRLDHALSANDSIFGRYTFDNADNLFPGAHPVTPNSLDSRNQYVTIEESHIFSPRWLNTFRMGYNRSRSTFISRPTIDLPASGNLVPGRPLLLTGSVGPGRGGPVSLATETRAPQNSVYNLFEYADDLTHATGNHTFKTGVLFKRLRLNRYAPRLIGGSLSFATIRTFLEGRPEDFRAPLPGADDAVRGIRQLVFGAYLQDDIAVRSNLTFNLGLRYEISTGPTEANNKFASIRPGDTEFRLVDQLFPTPSFLNLGPRVGFAWDPSGQGKTSIRGGYGIYYSANFPTDWEATAREGPFYKLAVVTSPTLPVWNFFVGGAQEPRLEPQSIDLTNVETMMQWNLNVQREINSGTVVTLGYIGSLGRHLKRNLQVNTNHYIFVDGKKFYPPGSTRVNPVLGDHKHVVTDGNSVYNGLVLGIKRRLSSGLQFQASYTYAKSMNDADTAFQRDVGNSTPGVQDPLDRKAERGLAAFHLKNNFSANFTYELPFGSGKPIGNSLTGAAATILSGWQINGLMNLSSGVPFSLTSTFNRSNSGTTSSTGSILTERPNLVGNNNNPVEGTTAGCSGVTGGRKLGSPDLYYDPCAFALQPAGYYGNLGRNTLIGPGFAGLDASLVKDTPVPSISESFKIQFRFEVFNVANRANFGIPQRLLFRSAAGIPAADAGRITNTVNAARQMQFALKILF